MAKTNYTLEEILIENSSYTNQGRMIVRLLRENLLDYICEVCGLFPEWNGKPLTLQLDHINGIANDNRIENLRFVCPNCHTQTDTYGSKNYGNGRGYKRIHYHYHKLKEHGVTAA